MSFPKAACIGFLFLAACAGWTAAPARHAPVAAEPFQVKIIEKAAPGTARLLAFNPFGAPVTVEIEPNLSASVAAESGSWIITCPPKTVLPVLTLRPLDPGSKWDYSYKYFWSWGTTNTQHSPTAVYRLPFAPGVRSRVDQGTMGSSTHKGESAHALDFAMPQGTTVLAARDGLVVHVQDGFGPGGPDPAYKEKANHVYLLHEDNSIAEYVHLLSGRMRVRSGMRVKVGTPLGESGQSGYSTGPHLHFMVFKARDARQRESIPVRFALGNGTIEALEESRIYQAP